MSSKPTIDKNNPRYLTGLYANARSNLLLVFVFSLINTLLSVTTASVYFLFSASFPYYALDFGYAFSVSTGDPIYYYIAMGLAILSLSLYLLCWILSKNHRGAMLTSAVLFGFDCLLLLALILLFSMGISSLLDILFHIIVMISLVRGYSAAVRLARAEEDPLTVYPSNEYINESLNIEPTFHPNVSNILQDSIPLRPVDLDAKARILIEGDYAGMNIQVRRVGRTTEFTVNNIVYAEQTSLIEGNYCWDIQVCRVPFHYENMATGLQTLSSNGVEFARCHRMF